METLIVACAALTRELRIVLGQLPETTTGGIRVEYLPSPLHNQPDRIPGRVAEVISEHAGNVDRVFVAYADCGTGGLLDSVLREHMIAYPHLSIERLPGAHCYEFFAGAAAFQNLHDAELGTFYLTDYLAKHFDALVIQGLGLDRHPELRDVYFGNYRSLVLLSQTHDADVLNRAEQAATQLGLAFEHHHTGLDRFRDLVTTRVTQAEVE